MKVEVGVEWRVKCLVFGEKQQGSGSEQRHGCRLVVELSDLTLVTQACVFPDEMQGAAACGQRMATPHWGENRGCSRLS